MRFSELAKFLPSPVARCMCLTATSEAESAQALACLWTALAALHATYTQGRTLKGANHFYPLSLPNANAKHNQQTSMTNWTTTIPSPRRPMNGPEGKVFPEWRCAWTMPDRLIICAMAIRRAVRQGFFVTLAWVFLVWRSVPGFPEVAHCRNP